MLTQNGLRPTSLEDGAIEYGGTAFFHRSIGSGRNVVMVHGGPGLGHAYLRPAMDALSDGFRLTYVDQRGSGETAVGDSARLNLPGAVDDLRGILDGLGIAQANLLGHSYGADLAALFAAAYPGRVGSLVLANPGPPLDMEGLEALEGAMMGRRLPADDAELDRIRQSAAFRARQARAVEAYIRNVYLPFFDDRKVGQGFAYGLTVHSAATVVEGEAALFDHLEFATATLAGLARLQAPALVVSAENDPIPEAFARSLAASIPGARLARLAGAGHFAYVEDPDAFFGVVRPFLDAVAVSTPAATAGRRGPGLWRCG